MKEKGQNMMKIKIIRQIDKLGRIVIPKDIRKTFDLINGDNIYITVDNDSIILKKEKRK